MATPIAEEVLIYLGHFLSLAVSVFITSKTDRKVGLLFIAAWLLQIQLFYFYHFGLIPEPAESAGACWSRLHDYYKCLPLIERVSIHLAQLGQLLLAFSIYLLARKAMLNRENS